MAFRVTAVLLDEDALERIELPRTCLTVMEASSFAAELRGLLPGYRFTLGKVEDGELETRRRALKRRALDKDFET